MSLPFLTKKPIDLPPIVSIELIQITDKTNIPFAPKAKKIIEEVKKKEEKLVSEQAPPKKIKKIKPDSIPMPDNLVKNEKELKEDKQNPEVVDNEVKQVSEFEKDELFDPNNIAALIDKSKEETAETTKKDDKVTQDQKRNVENVGLSLSEEDALKAQIFGCWSIPLGLPYNKNLLVRIKLQLIDGEVKKSKVQAIMKHCVRSISAAINRSASRNILLKATKMINLARHTQQNSSSSSCDLTSSSSPEDLIQQFEFQIMNQDVSKSKFYSQIR